MNENDYLLGWALYAAAALGCLLVWFRLTRWLWRWLREPLRVLVAVLLFTPTIVDPSRELLAPAVAVTALDVVFKVGNNTIQAAADLIMYGLVAFILYGIFVAVRWPLERRWRARRGAVEDEPEDDAYQPTLRELMAQGLDTRPQPRPAAPGPYGGRSEPRL
jgi:predicted permease